jgi:hypothetical protein
MEAVVCSFTALAIATGISCGLLPTVIFSGPAEMPWVGYSIAGWTPAQTLVAPLMKGIG